MRLLLILALATLPSSAHASAKSELQYKVEDVFSTAMRFVRVDRGCKITDKDADAAFVMFECPGDGKDEKNMSRGGVEIFRNGHDGTRVQITLSNESHGMELRWLELLERKLREERGNPVPPPKPAPPPKPPDMSPPPPF